MIEYGRYLVLGTAHVRCATAQLLGRWAALPATEQPLAVASTQCGWFLPTREAAGPRISELPMEIVAILAFGRDHDCSYVLLDSDGPEVDDLPTFPW